MQHTRPPKVNPYGRAWLNTVKQWTGDGEGKMKYRDSAANANRRQRYAIEKRKKKHEK